MVAANETIWAERLPRSGRILLDAPDLQVSPADFQVQAGGWIDHYQPSSLLTRCGHFSFRATGIARGIHTSNATKPVTTNAIAQIRSRLNHDRRSMARPNF